MKKIGTCLFAFMFAGSVLGEEPQAIDKPTERTKQVETQFCIKAIGTFKDKSGEFCVFVYRRPELTFDFVPIVVSVDAGDDQIRAAIVAAISCAKYYEDRMKEKHKK